MFIDQLKTTLFSLKKKTTLFSKFASFVKLVFRILQGTYLGVDNSDTGSTQRRKYLNHLCKDGTNSGKS